MRRINRSKLQLQQQTQVCSSNQPEESESLIHKIIDTEKETITADQLKLRQIRRSVEDHFLNIANRDPLFN